MHKTKLTALAISGLMMLTSVTVGGMTTSAESVSADDVKIMALGDSITDGYWTSGGYRKYLYHDLEQKGYSNIDMVGPKGSNTESFQYQGTSVSYDGNYAGYSGYAIQYITGTETRQGILETICSDYGNGKNMIAAYDPDVVLLQIGTNDILSNYNTGIQDRLENLVDTILADMTDDTDMLYVSTIPDIDIELRYDWLWSYGMSYANDPEAFIAKVQGCIDTYNASIQALVAEKQADGAKISFADIHSVVDQDTDLYDGVHPNEAGYEKMGQYWANLLDSTYLGGKSSTDTTTTQPAVTTTTETTTTTTQTSTTTSDTTKTTTTSATTSAVPATSFVTAQTTIAVDTDDIVLNDVKIGESYDLSAYLNDTISAISFTFDCTPAYGINGCAAFGNWEKQVNYTGSDLVDNTLTISLEKAYSTMVLYKWYGDANLKSVTLHKRSSVATTTKPTTTTTAATTTTAKPTTTTTAATTTTAKPTTTTTAATTTTAKPTTTTTAATTTTAKPTTTTTAATTTMAKPTTTTTTITTVSTTENTVVLTDVSYGEAYSLKQYDYSNIQKVVIEFDDNIGYGFGGAFVQGNWTVQNSFSHQLLAEDNTITYDITNPQDKFTLFRYWGEVKLKSVTLYFN